MDNHRQIEQIAAEWIVRRDSQQWTATDDDQLAQWLKSSAAHQAAFWRLEAAWEQTFRLEALGAGKKRGGVPAPGEWRVSPFFDGRQPVTESEIQPTSPRSRSKLLALAASVLIVAGIGAYVYPNLWGDRYSTPAGGIESIALKDGSSVTLNTQSKIRVALNDGERLVKLDTGEAFFEVAPDPRRPFIVQAGNKKVVAVGTNFSVRRDRDDVQVVVTEGKVRIEDATLEGKAVAAVSLDTSATLLEAGTIARTTHTRLLVQKNTPPEAEEFLSWRTGYLTFKALPLPEAIAEFNRYTPRKISIQDPQLESFHITGRFRATNLDVFLRLLREGYGIEAHQDGDLIILTGGPSGAFK